MKLLDAIDQRLLALLQDNARTPMVALARAVGLSRSATQERLQRLEQAGVIAGYTVRLAGQAPSLQAWLLLRHADGFSCEDVVPQLAALPAVQLCHSVAGELDLMVLVRVDTPAALAAVRAAVAALRGVDDVTTVTVLEVPLDRTT